jgi:hypothetical protein
MGSPKGDDVMRNLNISQILEKNGEDHFMRMNSQIKEFENIRRQLYQAEDDKGDSEKKIKPDMPKSLFSLKGS